MRGVDQLGDPFLRSAATAEPENQREVSDEEIRHEVRRQYDCLPATLASLGDFEYFYEQALVRRQEVAKKILQSERKNPILVTENQRKQVCLARFFESVSSLPLWQHYGNSHTGFAVGVDTGHAFFGSRTDKGQPQLFEAVTYRDTRPFVGETQRFLAPIFFQATGYQSDKEWRLVRPIDPGCEPEQMQVRFPVASVRRVVMGACMEKNAQDKIQQLMKNDPQLKKVPIFQAKLDFIKYRLVLEKVSE